MSYAEEQGLKFFLANNLWYKCGSNLSKTQITRHRNLLIFVKF